MVLVNAQKLLVFSLFLRPNCFRFFFFNLVNPTCVPPHQDALELPCVQAALSRVNLAVLSASEGLYEASAGGGVLLMGNRVAHPISQVSF